MRIALYHNLPPGGALRVVQEHTRRSTSTHDYDLFRIVAPQREEYTIRGDGSPAEDIASHVSSVHEYPLRAPSSSGRARTWLRPLLELRAAIELQRTIAADIDAGTYDLALVHGCHISQSPALLEHLKTPSVYFMQEPRRASFEFDYRPESSGPPHLRARRALVERMKRRVDMTAARAAGDVLCNSYYSRESIARAYGRDASVCYLGVDEQVFRPLPSSATRQGVVAVGGLEPFKGHELVIRALGRVPASTRPSLSVVYERSSLGQEQGLVDLATELGVDLRLRRGISDHELSELYARSVATVCAARLEPFGLTMLESLACGTPVVAVREGGYREVIIHGVTGLLVDRTPDALALGIEHVGAGGLRTTPEDLRAHVVPYWTWQESVDRLHRLLDAISR
jgi:glycosyltransferase involved in cell wall biosynthesis